MKLDLISGIDMISHVDNLVFTERLVFHLEGPTARFMSMGVCHAHRRSQFVSLKIKYVQYSMDFEWRCSTPVQISTGNNVCFQTESTIMYFSPKTVTERKKNAIDSSHSKAAKLSMCLKKLLLPS